MAHRGVRHAERASERQHYAACVGRGGCAVICRSQNFPWSTGVALYHVVRPALGPRSLLTGKLD
ncbi:hypothetical protein EYF80_053395 [Liparis tanakae]|uniref:Uncharacterized protein n=1 Tax=Liparis tanakae TaxID=230148 RepID=A0A4Z2F5P7_9TELE|nr:hypothetical protein EYF80_053395 [Liparis tanakae]